jgi:hypothetical protein
MGYLLIQMLWYVAAAFAVGLVVGWTTCSRVESDES